MGAQIARFGTPSTTNLSAAGGHDWLQPAVLARCQPAEFSRPGPHGLAARRLLLHREARVASATCSRVFRMCEGRNITYTLLFDNSLNVRTFASKREEASVQISQKFSKSLNRTVPIRLSAGEREQRHYPCAAGSAVRAAGAHRDLSANLVQDRRDNPADPHRGIYNTVDIGLPTKYFGSQRSFGRVLLRNATYYQAHEDTDSGAPDAIRRYRAIFRSRRHYRAGIRSLAGALLRGRRRFVARVSI